jgi:D-alanine-D-alanine ligase
MNLKIKVAIIYGGESFEHEASKMTAQSIKENIDRELFNVREIYIDKRGNFDQKLLKGIDIAFLAVHGPNCEDGKLQKFLENKNIKYAGSGVKASKINLDKVVMHNYFKRAGLKTVDYIGFDKSSSIENIEDSVKKIGLPVIIKPNNTGSSIGVSKVEKIDQFKKALKEAFKYDNKIIIEKAIINPREIEVAILENDKLVITEPGEIVTQGKLYSYESKYFKPFKTDSVAKNLSDVQSNKIKKMAETAYRVTGCSDYARVDFFMDRDGQAYINEINTLPGFTKTSMFPQLMQASGISYRDLITKIIKLALKR